MYSYPASLELTGPRLVVSPIRSGEVPEIARSLYSPTTWVVAVRGHDTPEKLSRYLGGFIEQDQKGLSLSVVARLAAGGEVVAISRFHSAPADFLRVEIGFTWIAEKWQRTFVNSELKRLMMEYAFGKIGVKRVEFSVDPINEKSNAAMLRLGAKFEGTLRKWRYLNERDLGNRNIYSILDEEWPGVKARLEVRG
jgi:RimJ/RimL family protein N-acetyltransferase